MEFEKLLEKAKEASKNSYSPYSKFKVGAAILYESGNVYTGCNVENVSYGLTNCAEQNTISKAISEGETSKLVAVAIYSPNQKNCLPCGGCRQWMAEFAKSNSELQIILEGEDSKPKTLILEDIFAACFKFD